MFVLLGLSLVLLSGMTAQTHASESFTVTTDLYAGFDLATGMTELDPTVITIIIGHGTEIDTISAPSRDPLFEFNPSIDLYFGFSPDAEQPITITAANLNGMAVFDDADFETILDEIMTREDLPVPSPIATLDNNDIVVLVTLDDEFILLGDVMLLPDARGQFSYRIVDHIHGGGTGEVPEPGTLLLLGAGIVGLIRITIRKRKNLQGGKSMKYGKIVVFTLMFIAMFAGVTSALELQILVIGHGYVQGERGSCSSSCTETYEKGTVVHFKAIPFPDARFAGWKINGIPHEGVITLEEDTVLSAVFERTEDPMLADGVTVYWYDSNGGRDYAKIALDEMLIRLKDLEEWDSSTEAKYNTVLEKIRQTFHPQAEIATGDPTLLLVESPESLEKDLWFKTIMTLQESPYVQWAGPILYRFPGEVWSQIMVWDTISVEFPESYTEDQIRVIEQDYGLVRLESVGDDNSFIYQAGSPLKAIEVANRLYESGSVEYSQPAIAMYDSPMSEPNDKLFKKQWHLNNTMYAGEDINILPVWENYKGSGVVIAIVDDGVEFVHPDLKLNEMKPENYHYDFIEGDHAPIDNNLKKLAPGVSQKPGTKKPAVCASGCHGTAVAGVAAAEGFNEEGIGITGIAPFASLIGYRKYLCDPLKGDPCIYSFSRGDVYKGLFTGGKEGSVDIYNNSWGSGDTRAYADRFSYKEVEVGTTKQHIIYVWGAGNIVNKEIDDGAGNKIRVPRSANTNYYGFTNTRYTIAVGASGVDGEAHGYSTPGATVLVNAPSGLWTTDRLGGEGYSSETIEVNSNFINFLGTQCHIPSDFYTQAISPLLGQNFENINELLKAIENEAINGGLSTEQIAQNNTLILECAQGEHRNENYFPYGDYTNFSGTSAAAPVVSGVVALMLDARRQKKPDKPLTWRDVQHILIETAHKNRGEAGDMLAQEWQDNTNAAGYSHLYKYGFGRVDAGAAVDLAMDWTRVASETASQQYSFARLGLGEARTFDKPIHSTLTIPENLAVEFADVTFSSDYPRWGDLEITLTSPATCFTLTGSSFQGLRADGVPESVVNGLTSLQDQTLCPQKTFWESIQEKIGQEHTAQYKEMLLTHASASYASILATPIDSEERSYHKWKFGSRRHFGELSQGDWILTIHDKKQRGNTGKWYAWDLQLYGTELPTWEVITLGSLGTCEAAEDGTATCSFEGSSVTLQPADEEDSDLTFFVDVTEPKTEPSEEHTGTYWFPNRLDENNIPRIKVAAELVSQRSWFNLPTSVPEPLTRDCHEGPPEDESITSSAAWRIRYHEESIRHGDQEQKWCHLSFLINGTPVVTSVLEAPPGKVCDVELPSPRSGTLTATQTRTWHEDKDLRQEEGTWVATILPGGVESHYDSHCRAELLKGKYPLWEKQGHFGSSWVYLYQCSAREPWPPPPPDADSICPAPDTVSPENLHDLSIRPPDKVCTKVELKDFIEFDERDPETRDEYYACNINDPHTCVNFGGGHYPIELTVKNYFTWEKVVTGCTSTYHAVEDFEVQIDSGELPPMLGLIELREAYEPQPN